MSICSVQNIFSSMYCSWTDCHIELPWIYILPDWLAPCRSMQSHIVRGIAIIDILYCRLGWSDLKKICYTFYIVQNCCRTSIPKFHVFMLPLSLVAGPQISVTVTLKWAKHKKKTFLGFTWNKMCSLACVKAKTEEILKQICFTIF